MRSALPAIMLVWCFVALVFTSAWFFVAQYPALMLAGEDSAGTWVSGFLLVVCASLLLIRALQRNDYGLFFVSAFFMVLAADEHFMIHEAVKRHLVFHYYSNDASELLYEIPVLAGAVVGLGVAFLLWNRLHRAHRRWLIVSVVLGAVSVILDVTTSGVVPEEVAKLLAELVMTSVLIANVAKGANAVTT